jgi:hypothetical protein
MSAVQHARIRESYTAYELILVIKINPSAYDCSSMRRRRDSNVTEILLWVVHRHEALHREASVVGPEAHRPSVDYTGGGALHHVAAHSNNQDIPLGVMKTQSGQLITVVNSLAIQWGEWRWLKSA